MVHYLKQLSAMQKQQLQNVPLTTDNGCCFPPIEIMGLRALYFNLCWIDKEYSRCVSCFSLVIIVMWKYWVKKKQFLNESNIYFSWYCHLLWRRFDNGTVGRSNVSSFHQRSPGLHSPSRGNVEIWLLREYCRTAPATARQAKSSKRSLCSLCSCTELE